MKYSVIRTLTIFVGLIAGVAAKIPCWGIYYQPETPTSLVHKD